MLGKLDDLFKYSVTIIVTVLYWKLIALQVLGELITNGNPDDLRTTLLMYAGSQDINNN